MMMMTQAETTADGDITREGARGKEGRRLDGERLSVLPDHQMNKAWCEARAVQLCPLTVPANRRGVVSDDKGVVGKGRCLIASSVSRGCAGGGQHRDQQEQSSKRAQ